MADDWQYWDPEATPDLTEYLKPAPPELAADPIAMSPEVKAQAAQAASNDAFMRQWTPSPSSAPYVDPFSADAPATAQMYDQRQALLREGPGYGVDPASRQAQDMRMYEANVARADAVPRTADEWNDREYGKVAAQMDAPQAPVAGPVDPSPLGALYPATGPQVTGVAPAVQPRVAPPAAPAELPPIQPDRDADGWEFPEGMTPAEEKAAKTAAMKRVAAAAQKWMRGKDAEKRKKERERAKQKGKFRMPASPRLMPSGGGPVSRMAVSAPPGGPGMAGLDEAYGIAMKGGGI